MHDESVEKTTDGHGRIKDLTLAQIKLLNAAAHWPNSEDYDGIKVPTLREVFDEFKDEPSVRFNIEIKPRDT